ncbi:MAG: hypothetical protein AAFZ01_00690 [Pseudomonadota bacterium]
MTERHSSGVHYVRRHGLVRIAAACTAVAVIAAPTWAQDNSEQAPPEATERRAVASASQSAETPLRLMSLDLNAFWHQPDDPLRAGAPVRNVEQLRAMRRAVLRAKPDLVALQGVGSPRAARLLFPARNYYVVFSRELAVRQQRSRDILRNPSIRRSYSAVVVRRGSGLRMLARKHILEMADPSPALGAERPQGQSGVAVKLKHGARQFWFASARLMDGCGKGASPAAERGCRALRDQVQVLNVWKSGQAARRQAVIIGLAVPRASGEGLLSEAVRSAWQVLERSDPSRVTLAHRRALARLRKSGDIRRFVLSNPVRRDAYGGTIDGTTRTIGGGRQVAELRGPSRSPGKPLVDLSNTPAQSADTLVVSALKDFARAALTPDRRSETADEKAKPAKTFRAGGATSKLTRRTLAGLSTLAPKRGIAAKATAPHEGKTPTEQRLHSADASPFVRKAMPHASCNQGTLRQSVFLLSRALVEGNTPADLTKVSALRRAPATGLPDQDAAAFACAPILALPPVRRVSR